MPSISEVLDSMDYGPAPESADHALKWLERGPFGHFINGAFTAPDALFTPDNPATGAPLAQLSQGSADDIDAAVAAARAAFGDWSARPGHERARYLYAMARHIQKRERLFAVLEVLDNGKPIREARDIDIPLAVRHFYHHAGWAELVVEEFPNHRPHGVCGQIIPWNFPLLMLAWKIAPALAAGNTVVLKPAEYTPLTALLFAEICTEIGLPPGVVNIVTGDGTTGAALVAHEGVDKIAFTGSTAVGREIRRATAGTGKALTLELGGKSPFIVFADADLDAAVEGVVDAIWFNQGEVCCAGSRILVAEAVAPRFEALLRARMGRLRAGDPLDKGTDIGAIVHPRQLERITGLVDQAQAQGATVHAGTAPQGCFCPPMLLTDVAPANIAVTEEIFGPVAVMMTFRTPPEALELANNTRYGLAASVWTENIGTAMDVAANLRAGVVWINATNLFDANAPFGGMRESGFGREGGRAGMLAYLAAPGPQGRAPLADSPAPVPLPAGGGACGGIDRTTKLFIGGAFKRADAGQSWSVHGAGGDVIGQAPWGSRKDIRNAVEAAAKVTGWGRATGHERAQVLYFLAENMDRRRAEMTEALVQAGSPDPAAEVDCSIRRAFLHAAWADKLDGRVHATRSAHVTLAMNVPHGVMGVICPDAPALLGFVSLVLPAIAMGNRVVVVPSQTQPLPALDFGQLLVSSDVPGGVVNIVSGPRAALTRVLAAHDGVDALCCVAPPEVCAMAEAEAAGNLKPVWTESAQRDWFGPAGQEAVFREFAVQVKTVWTPYGA